MSLYYKHMQRSAHSNDIFESVFKYDIDGIPVCVKVRIKKDAIDFYADDDNVSHEGIVRRQEHLFTIPLETPERTDYFLLQVREIDERICFRHKSPDYKLFYANRIPNKRVLEVPGAGDLTSIHELLLCLFDELNNPGSDICRFSPSNARSARERLESSAVYQLIRKKYDFYKALFEWEEAGNSGYQLPAVKLAYHEFLEGLVKDTLTKEIPPNRMAGDNWFDNPEAELEILAKLNKEHNIDPESVEDIQRYFLTKHAMFSAIHLESPFNMFLQIVGQSIGFILFLVVFFLWLNNVFIFTDIVLTAGILISTLSFMVGFAIQPRLSVYLPRIMVALASAWFIIVASEDIIKNQLNTPSAFIEAAIPFIFFIISVFLFAESRQHSPYYNLASFINFKDRFSYKILPVVVCSFNISVIMGVLTQLTITDTIIENSQILQDHVFAGKLDTLTNVHNSYQNFSNDLNVAKQVCANSFSLLTNKNIITELKMEDRFVGQKVTGVFSSDNALSILPSYIATYNSFKAKLKIDTASEFYKDIVARKLEKTIQSERVFCKIDSTIIDDNNLAKEKLCLEFTRDYKAFLSAEQADSIFQQLKKNLRTNKNYDILMDYVTYREAEVTDTFMSYGFDYKTDKDDIISVIPFKKYQEARCVKSSENTQPDSVSEIKRIFPRMLMFQVMVAMALALITQLIVSDKTVTEPL